MVIMDCFGLPNFGKFSAEVAVAIIISKDFQPSSTVFKQSEEAVPK